jgi:Protein kinase domain
MRPRSILAALVGLPLAAQSWPTFFSAYEDGLAAQSRGDHALAAKAFARAASLNPRPGRSVRTYGLNYLSTYYPYLRLAESQLALADPDAAEAALKQSAALGLEPPGEREGLVGRLKSLRDARARPVAPSTQEPRTAGTAPERAAQAPAPPVSPGPSPGPPQPAPPGTVPEQARPTSPPKQLPRPIQAPPPATDLPAKAVPEAASTPPPAEGGTKPPDSGVPSASAARAGRRSPWIWFSGAGVALSLGAALALRPKKGGAGSAPTLRLDRENQTIPIRAATSEEGAKGTGDPNLGRTFGPYRPTGILGQGGCATTYRGRHLETGEEVAIKVPHRHLLQDGEFKARFRREASLGSLLDHPRIVPILDPGPPEGDPWLAMPFIHGVTLDRYLAEKGPLGVPEAIGIACDISEAIGFAHSKGIVHRDLKPGNVMMTGAGALILDFGIARMLDGALTVSTMFLGTPLYSAPECVVTPRVGPPADRYALGIMLFEFLAGAPPFHGESHFQILEAQRSQPLPDLPPHCAGVPPRLLRLIQRLCAKAPEERPEDGETSIILNELKGEYPPAPPVLGP